MTRNRDPFHQALGSLRLRVEQGFYGAGQPVVIVEEARRLRLSTTPVREALAWLAGAGLVERAPLGGYVTLQLDPATVRDRLAFRLHCLRLSLDGTAGLPAASAPDEEGVRAMLHRDLDRLVQSSGSDALLDAFRRVSSRLAQIRGAEEQVFADLDDEAAGISTLLAQADIQALEIALSRYHHRRMEAAALLVLETMTGTPSDAGEDAP
ncbi:GntR family transcriptional regulator [Brevundimonas bullata]|uniref:GntR family transcriptional regulator n=1 Tax=Brevundimonas bullata TaxID=13160 RepID=UPI000E0B4D2B|nr:GntR family transcriptional regulator [Brevundimonas bullata]WQE38307.1 GntR family transcriptional regulator [Brevundimonas bullata]